MVDKTRIREVEITQKNLDYKYFNINTILNFFPSDVIGGSNKSFLAKKSIHIITDNGLDFWTDIAGDKKIFRNRGQIRRFYHSRFADGDTAYIFKINNYEYFLSKNKESIERRYSKSQNKR